MMGEAAVQSGESIAMAPPGDLRNVLVALSDMPQFYEDISNTVSQKRKISF